MSNGAINSFLPWLRRGVSASIGRTDDAINQGAHAGFNVEMGFNSPLGGDPSLTESITISLYGPGEVISLDRQTITRTWPHADVVDAEANYFPLIEFSQADLPWRYTPARAKRQDQLKPWMVLIALRDDEIEHLEPASPDRLLPVITVKDGGILPNLDQSGAWAHVHVSGSKINSIDNVPGILTDKPHSFASRLLCPRRLDNLTRYTAFLVPAFERGRLKGLNQSVDEKIDALEKAWEQNDKLLQLPVYYMWSFKTGPLGDFEYLVSLLEPYKAESNIGFRDLDVTKPGLGLPEAAGKAMLLDGALVTNATVINTPIEKEFIEKIVEKLNLPADFLAMDKQKSVVVPPLYGQVYADRFKLPTTLDVNNLSEPPTVDRKWFWRININPIRRVASGLGTQVIQSNQQQLMASAWEQVEAIRKANRDIRFAQLSMEISASSYGRNIKSQKTEAAIFLTTPSHNKVSTSWSPTSSGCARSRMIVPPTPSTTSGSLIRKSSISRGALDPQWRRRSSPLGTIGRRQGRPDLSIRPDFLKRMGKDISSGGLAASKPPATPDSMLPFSKAQPPPEIDIKGPAIDSVRAAPGTLDFAIDTVLEALKMAPDDEKLQGFTSDNLDALASNIVKELEPRKNIAWGVKRRIALTEDILYPVIIPPDITPPDIIAPAYKLSSTFSESPEKDDELKPIMRAPEFPKPMYGSLRDLSQDWLLPGVEKLPENSVTLLDTNQEFIEAFMVGLNHEMARELLWNGYPTDMKGTYFTQFWDSSGTISAVNVFSWGKIPGNDERELRDFLIKKFGIGWVKFAPIGKIDDKVIKISYNEKSLTLELDDQKSKVTLKIDGNSIDELRAKNKNGELNIYSAWDQKDIMPIHTWDNHDLGDNTARILTGKKSLVLLVRGELLKRYPNTIIYAAEAVRNNSSLEIGPEEKHPIFSGKLNPDISFFGFDLTPEAALGDNGDPGWFFVLQEQPSEPHFGLDVAADDTIGHDLDDWEKLSWGHLVDKAEDLEGIVYIDLNADRPHVTAPGYVFNWDKVPGEDEGQLRKLLANKPSFEWVKTAMIEKSIDGKTIKISTGDKSIFLELDGQKTKVILKIDGTNIGELIAKDEDGEINVYALGIIKWHDGGSSDLAYATYQLQVRVAFYARAMLPKS